MAKRHLSSLFAAALICGLAIASAPEAHAAQTGAPPAGATRVEAAHVQAGSAQASQTPFVQKSARAANTPGQQRAKAASSMDAGASTWESRTVLDHGHVDAFSVFLEGDVAALALSEDVTKPHNRQVANEVLLHVKEAAYTEATTKLPGIKRAGYALPQTQNPNLLWPGWDSMAIADEMPNAAVDLTIDAVSGPGEVFV